MFSKNSSDRFEVKEGEELRSKTSGSRYMIMNFIGEGSFGKVARCFDSSKSRIVAVKMFKNSESSDVRKEVEMLEKIKTIDPDKNNIAKFMEYFRFNRLACLTFEILDKSLWDLMKERRWKEFGLNEIRTVTHQLLVAFEALKLKGIMHTDLKPDNVMLVDHLNQPFKIKLIDFGLAVPVDKVRVGTIMQAGGYRAPEVTLGLPLSESVDMWGVGCIMAFLYFGNNLFPADCAYRRIKLMLELLGEPADRLLDIGLYSKYYFTKAKNSRWTLKTTKEYEEGTGLKASTRAWHFKGYQTLDNIVRSYPSEMTIFDSKDRLAFADLMTSCLHPNYYDRITPKKAMKHTFFDSPQDSDKSDYVECRKKSYSSLSPGEIPIIGCSSTDTDSSSGIDAREDGKGLGKKECAPVKPSCGQTDARPRDEEQRNPEYLDNTKDGHSSKESYFSSLDLSSLSDLSGLSDLSSLSLSSEKSPIAHSSSGMNSTLDGDGKETEKKECTPGKRSYGQTDARPWDEEEHNPEDPKHADNTKDGSSCKESNLSSLSDLSSFSLSLGEISIMDSSSTDTERSNGIHATLDEEIKVTEKKECVPGKRSCGQTDARPQDEEHNPEDSDTKDGRSSVLSHPSSLSLSSGKIQIMDSSSGINSTLDGDGKETEKKECTPGKRSYGQTDARPRDEEEHNPEDSDTKDGRSSILSVHSNLSLSSGKIQIIDSFSGINSTLHGDGKETGKKECALVNSGCGQSYTRPEDEEERDPKHADNTKDGSSCKESNLSSLSDLSSFSLSLGEISIMDSSSTDTERSNGIHATLDEEIKETEKTECVPVKCGCGQPYTRPEDDEERDPKPRAQIATAVTIATRPVRVRRKTVLQRIGSFFGRVRKLFCCTACTYSRSTS